MTCKYCDDLIALNLIDTQDSIEKNTLKISSPKNIMAYIDNDCLTAESFDAYANIKIKYCPMCGRKLGEQE